MRPDTVINALIRIARRAGEVADDYERLTIQEFDTKYPGWANSEVFDQELRAEFQRRRPAPPLNEGSPRPPEVSDE